MERSLGQTIADRLGEFTDALKRGDKISEKFTCRKIVLNLEPTKYRPKLVKETREILGVSQAVFAMFIGVSVSTVQKWERGENLPKDTACRMMDEIRHDPDYWRSRFLEMVEPKEEAECV